MPVSQKIPKAEIERRMMQSLASRKSKANKQSKVGQVSVSSLGRVKTAPVAAYRELITKFMTGPSKRGSEAIMVSGTDYIGQVNVPSNNAGYPLFSYAIGPGGVIFQNTRLSALSALYEKYIFTRLRFHIQSGNPSSASGSYILSFDRDVSDPVPSQSDVGIKQLFANKGARSAAVWESISIDCPLADSQNFYYTNYQGGDARLAYQGRLLGAIMTPTSQTTNFAVWVEYEIHLMDPSLSFNDANTEQVFFPPTNQYPNYTALAGMSVLPLASCSQYVLPNLQTVSNTNVFIPVPAPSALESGLLGNITVFANQPSMVNGFGPGSGTASAVSQEMGFTIPGGSSIVEISGTVTLAAQTGTQNFEVGFKYLPNISNVSLSNYAFDPVESSLNPATIRANGSTNSTAYAGKNAVVYSTNTSAGDSPKQFVTFNTTFVLNLSNGGGIFVPYLVNLAANVVAISGVKIRLLRFAGRVSSGLNLQNWNP